STVTSAVSPLPPTLRPGELWRGPVAVSFTAGSSTSAALISTAAPPARFICSSFIALGSASVASILPSSRREAPGAVVTMMGTRRTTAARMIRTERRPSRAVSLMRTVAGILGSEECEDGEDSAVVRGVGGEAELREHRADVLLNGSGAEVEDSGDRG